jgi:FkbM family methyltransferase
MERDLVFDIGVNNGEDTAYYLRRGFRVVGVDANPAMVAFCEGRFEGEIRAGRLTLLNVGLAADEGTASFFVSEGNGGVWSSLDPALALRGDLGSHAVTVQARSLRSLVQEYGVPFYLKVDIEGAEHLCLRDIDRTEAPAYVSFEAHEGRLENLFLLVQAGYTRFKLIDQLTFRQVMPPRLHSWRLTAATLSRLAKEQLRRIPGLVRVVRLVRRERPAARSPLQLSTPRPPESSMSSGPMAEDTDGPWRSVEDVAYAWLYYVRETITSNWYDVHAAR